MSSCRSGRADGNVLTPDPPRGPGVASEALEALLRPRSIAVIGASRSRGTVGGDLFHNLVHGGFTGGLYPVNPVAPVVQDIPAFASILDVPDQIDLAVVVVPAAAVAGVARECAEKGVKALVVVSAGFSEIGPEGAARQDELLGICRRAGMRLVGPNCMGVVNTAPNVSMNAQFVPIEPPAGNVAFLSQSGALGLALLDHSHRLGLGVSTFVSVGNKADLSGNDFLEFWEDDASTEVILLYLESLGDARRFADIARRITRTRPIVAVKGGRSTAGARATSSHTGALLGPSDAIVDAVFRQAGVIRTETIGDLFDVASVLSSQPLPEGRRVAVISNGGGPGILAADACEAAGLEVPTLPEALREGLVAWLPVAAGVSNPIDMISSATAADYGRAIGEIAADPSIDALIVIFAPPVVTQADDVATAIRDAAADLARPIPIVAVFMASGEAPSELQGDVVRIPSFTYPENAARALGHAARYARWRSRDDGRAPVLQGVDGSAATAAMASFVEAGSSRWLDPSEVRALLKTYGLPVIAQVVARTPADAALAAAQFSGPVALKGVASRLVHKTEAGAVRLDLATPADVEAAATDMAAVLAGADLEPQGFLVQPMVGRGVEMLVGIVRDPSFGPIVACAAGGTQAEVLKDVSMRLTPLTDVDAQEMIRSLGTFPLLEGYRGAPRADVAALEDVVHRVGALAAAHPEIAEMDLNPVVVGEHGASIVDGRIRIAPP